MYVPSCGRANIVTTVGCSEGACTIASTSKIWDTLRLLRHGGPALCNIAITNSCNATCDFCNFANGKIARKHLHWLDANRLNSASEILYRRGIRYVSFFGGEPLLHPDLPRMIAGSVAQGMVPAIITNGWLLPKKLNELVTAGLKNVYVSIDAASIAAHEQNRGLNGLCRRIREANARMRQLDMMPMAQVTMSKLVHDYAALVPFLRELDFAAVAFSYPQAARLGSSSLAWSSSSDLVNFSDRELEQAFESVDQLRRVFPVNNPHASVADMKRQLRGEPQRFVCYGGYKSFYMDWNFDIWRCDAWHKPMCSVWDFENTPLVRDGCMACRADCYRDSSVMLHFAVSLGDALDRLSEGHLLGALREILDTRNLESVGAVLGNAGVLSRLAKVS
jgi:MoaA/NifB/PqqE/SkfB family radical SAM enzyme